MSSALLQIEAEMVDRIESFAFFADLTVLADPKKNIVAEIQSKIGKLKTLIAPKIVGADDNHPNVHGVYFDEIRMVVGVFQNPTLKGNHPEPFEICEEIHKAFKNWTPDSLSNVMNPRKPGIEQIADKQLNIFNCNFETKGGFVGTLAQCATPEISYVAGLVTITCSTPGAVIFYTDDGGKPTTQSELYLTPFSAAGGSGIKARAWRPGMLTSRIASYTVPVSLGAGGVFAGGEPIYAGGQPVY